MHLLVPTFLIIAIAVECRIPSAWLFLLCLLTGMLFVTIHRSMIGKSEDAPIGISVLVVVLAAAVGIMIPKMFIMLMQLSGLFAAGTILRIGISEALGHSPKAAHH
ncbi:MAG: hypothetical protein A2511_00810 [Deltaproteobacteria bacterium RIFOXYD12_FULL_50_9]|nr:MAG: hypothetical protein A2511_00810 [Deltaproteobacteria bacterium RIFOXYD12_FULL_50_9]